MSVALITIRRTLLFTIQFAYLASFMTDPSLKTTLISGITQAVIGVLSMVLGIVEIGVYVGSPGRKEIPPISIFTGIAIWAGIWILITGIIGICAIRRGACCCVNGVPDGYSMQGDCCASLKCMIGLYMGFSITGSVFAGFMIMMYGLNVAWFTRSSFAVISWLMLILSIGAFGTTIWAAVCCCKIICSGQNLQTAPTGTVVYTQTQGPPAVYIVVQGADGTPVAIPAQTSGPMTEPGGTPVNNPADPAAVPPHYYPGAQESQSNENSIKVAL